MIELIDNNHRTVLTTTLTATTKRTPRKQNQKKLCQPLL
jgi:hypothetical protein